MARPIDIPSDELAAAYLAGWSTPALARRYGCSPATIAKRLRAAGIALRDARFHAIPVAEAALRRLYLDEQLPIAAIAAVLGVSASTVGNKRRAYGIPIRTMTDDQLRAWDKAGRKAALGGIVTHAQMSRVFKKSTHWDPGEWPSALFMRRVRKAAAKLEAGK